MNADKKSSNDILMLIGDLKNRIQNFEDRRISDKELSKFLGQGEDFVRYTKKNYTRNPDFQISHQELEEFKIHLKEIFEKKALELIKVIRKYKINNFVKIGKNKIYDYHPYFVENYFKNITTKEKAYWLGFIYADGTLGYKYGVSNKKGERYLRFRFGLSPNKLDNIYIVKKFAKTIGIKEEFLKETKGKSKNGNEYRKYGFEISSQIFCTNLNKNGVLIGKKKTYYIQLPDFKILELNLAFLLGYYDGDGTTGTSLITSASKKFLEQIRFRYKIKHKLMKADGKAWKLSLGADLFNLLMDNYKDSLPRKRRYFETMKERKIRMRMFNPMRKN